VVLSGPQVDQAVGAVDRPAELAGGLVDADLDGLAAFAVVGVDGELVDDGALGKGL